jgi:hypothetical protein
LNNELYGKIEMMKFHDVRKYAFIAMNLYKDFPDASMQSRFLLHHDGIPFRISSDVWLAIK